MLRIVVLISGSGSNLQALLDACKQPEFDAEVVRVISNRSDAFGLERAQQANVSTSIVEASEFDSREAYDQALMLRIDDESPDLVVLAGFMRILSAEFVNHYAGRLINIHPSLLPKYKGLKTHQRALDAQESIHGASVHFVTEDLDDGPIVLQASVAVEADDTPETLAARVLQQEHVIYPMVIGWIASGRLALSDSGPVLDGDLLRAPLQLEDLQPS